MCALNTHIKVALKSQNPKIGFMLPVATALQNTLDDLKGHGYEFMVLDLVRKTPDRRYIPIIDLALTSADWIGHVNAYIKTDECYNIDQATTPFLNAQLNHAAHLSIRDLIVQTPEDFNAISRLNQILMNRMANGFINSKVHFHLPIQSKRVQATWFLKNPEKNQSLPRIDTLAIWDNIRAQMGYDRRIGVALELDGDLPDVDACERWLGETISTIIIPFSLFMPTPLASVKIPNIYAAFISACLDANARQITIIVKGHVPPHVHNLVIDYIQELAHTGVSENLVDEFAIGYEDYLQVPLQPLADNLEAATYEIFEKDPIKYEQYKDAMARALKRFPKDQRVTVLLVGAGRGPLIRSSLTASEEVGRFIDLYAIEKNENAAFTLKSQVWAPPATDGKVANTVTIVNTDIRDWDSHIKADILISELLGSFGDNELSPECIDGAWRNLKPTAISIPESYTSYIQPIMSNRLYTETIAGSANRGSQYTDIHFVTHMKSYFQISQVKPLFEFKHTDLHLPPKTRDNNRYKTLSFKPRADCTVHGFAGYFETTLIDEIKLSIVPDNHTQALISWFPTWIPLADPIRVNPNDNISVHFWRNVGKTKVWYEWCITSPTPTRIQNVAGKSYSVGLGN